MLDLSKAFDTVPHKRLLTKLRYYRINESDSTYNWIQTWLTHRSQCRKYILCMIVRMRETNELDHVRQHRYYMALRDNQNLA